MKLGLAFPELLSGVLTPVHDELELLVAHIKGGWGIEHDGNGHHTAVQSTQLQTEKITSAASLLRIDTGMKWLRGPLTFEEEGNNDYGIAAIRAPQLTANQNDYNPVGLASAIILELDATAARTITGLVTPKRQRRWLQLTNRSNFVITLSHNSGSSTSVYRFAFPTSTDYPLASGESLLLFYDVGSEIWRPVGSMASAIKSIQEGSTTLNGGVNSANSTINAVTVAKTVVLSRQIEDARGDTGVRVSLANSTTVTVARDTTNNGTTYYWVAIEYT